MKLRHSFCRTRPVVILLSSYVLPFTSKSHDGLEGGEARVAVSHLDRFGGLLAPLARTLAARDHAMHEHAQRVRRYAVALAREVRIADGQMIEAIDMAALLHDIGKLGIPDRVLQKPGPLTREEYEQVKQHAVIGGDLLSAVPFEGPLMLIVRHHHECWDGTGYPDRLSGEAIPLGARVLAVVDCYDALVSDRPYREALSHETAIGIIEERRGTMYDPDLTDAFLRIVHRQRTGAMLARGGDAARATEQEARAG